MEEHPQARYIIDTLHQAGYTAYYAGGWVRDFILQHPSDDIDIATNAPPETIQALFSHTIPIGIAFGIILVIIDGHQYEVATFRQDLDYHDGRRPTRIEFSSAAEDAKRRDFTINGMFYDPIHKEILDYVGGKEDLRAQVIRAIGDPHQRIKEDRLRMIRAIRLACRFHFQIEQKTQDAIRAHAKELFPSVAIERIVQELAKGQAFGQITKMLLMLHEYGLLSSIFPGAAEISLQELKERLAPTAHYLQDAPLIAFLLPMFPHYSLDDQIALVKYLKLPNLGIQFVTYLFHAKKMIFADGPIENVEWAHLYANAFCPVALQIISAHHSKRTFLQEHEQRIQHLQKAIERIRTHTPVVTSSDLKKAGISPGPQMGSLLKEAERISCNEGIDESGPILDRLRRSPLWPS